MTSGLWNRSLASCRWPLALTVLAAFGAQAAAPTFRIEVHSLVLASAQTRFASAFGTPGVHFAAYIALYPDCNARLIGDANSEPGPQRIFTARTTS